MNCFQPKEIETMNIEALISMSARIVFTHKLVYAHFSFRLFNVMHTCYNCECPKSLSFQLLMPIAPIGFIYVNSKATILFIYFSCITNWFRGQTRPHYNMHWLIYPFKAHFFYGWCSLCNFWNLIEIYHRPHYNVNLQGISVGDTTLQLPTSTFNTGDNKGTIIDSGTTLAYLPGTVYKTLLDAVWKLIYESIFVVKSNLWPPDDVFLINFRYLISIKIWS